MTSDIKLSTITCLKTVLLWTIWFKILSYCNAWTDSSQTGMYIQCVSIYKSHKLVLWPSDINIKPNMSTMSNFHERKGKMQWIGITKHWKTSPISGGQPTCTRSPLWQHTIWLTHTNYIEVIPCCDLHWATGIQFLKITFGVKLEALLI